MTAATTDELVDLLLIFVLEHSRIALYIGITAKRRLLFQTQAEGIGDA